MNRIGIKEFLEIAREVVGEDEETRLDNNILDETLTELNFDSLHVVAVIAKMEEIYEFRFQPYFEKTAAESTPAQILDIASKIMHAKQINVETP